MPMVSKCTTAPFANLTASAKTPVRFLSSSSAIAIMIAVSGCPAMAQTSAGTETVTVTSTRVNSADVPTPLLTLDQSALQIGAPSNVVEALVDLPQFKASSNPQQNSGDVFDPGAWAINLRGLGPQRTLVLVDGVRLVNSYGAPDYSIIPSILVKRVDVVTGSASAAWGSNAVAGVVNFILDDKLDGLKARVQGGISGHGDVAEERFEVAYGTDFANDKGHIIFGADFVNNDGTGSKSTARPDYARWAPVANPNYTPTNGQHQLIIAPDVGYSTISTGGLILSGVNAGKTFNADGTLRPFNAGTLAGGVGFGGEGPSFDDVVRAYAPSTRYDLFARASYDFSPSLHLHADLQRSNLYSNYSNFFNAFDFGDITITADNAFLSPTIRNQMAAAGQTSFTLGRFNSDFASFNLNSSRFTTQAKIALDGDLGSNWQWDAHYAHGDYLQKIQVGNQVVGSNFFKAIDSVISPTTGNPICRVALTDPSTNCAPINLFGQGAPSAAARAFVRGASNSATEITLDTGAATLRGQPISLWAGPVQAAFGIEGRQETLNQSIGPLDAASALMTYNATAYKGHNATGESFAELLIPLVRDVPVLELLQFDGAARYTTDRTGSYWSWKLGATDRVTDDLELRFTRSRDIRAPNLEELFSTPLGPGLFNLFDPKTNSTYLVQAFTGGNPDLKAEISATTTVGATLTLPEVPDLRLSVDYFDINIANAIGQVSTQNVVNLCSQGNAQACSEITRGSNGLITTVRASQLNFVNQKQNGLDVALDYKIPLDLPGSLKFHTDLTWTTLYSTFDGFSRNNLLGNQGGTTGASGLPFVQFNSTLQYDADGYSVYSRGRYISEGYFDRTLDLQNGTIPAFFYVDIGASAKVAQVDGSDVELYGAINNLLDKQPPHGVGYSTQYDVVGRQFVLGVRLGL
jgi:iron complex outermembrane receptor protein